MIVKAGFRRRALVVALTTIYGVGSQLAQANPTGAQVVNGQANLQTQGGKLTVTNTPGVLTEDTADMTMALILSVARRLVEGANAIPDGSWPGWSPTWMLGHRIGGKRLGIIGMGRIGQAVARRARAFGMQIHYHNRKPVSPRVAEELEIPDEGIELEAMVEQLERTLLRKALERTSGVKKEAAKILGISFRALRYRLDKYGMNDGED